MNKINKAKATKFRKTSPVSLRDNVVSEIQFPGNLSERKLLLKAFFQKCFRPLLNCALVLQLRS